MAFNRFFRLAEKTLMGLLLGSFVLPLVLGFWLWEWHGKSAATLWLRNATLQGVQLAPERVPLSRSTLSSGKFQSAFAANYDTHFPGRELLIRLANELSLRLFHASGAGVLVGPRLSLVETNYATEYCLLRPAQDALRPLAADLRRMQDACDSRGIAFALVITPSKAAVYPESLPAAWLRRRRPEPRAYDNFLPLLRENGVRFVDGHRLAIDMKPTARVPLFPLGGVHWGDPAAFATTNALLSLLAREGLRVGPAAQFRTVISDRPDAQDRDMADLINPLFRWRYPVAAVKVRPVRVPPGDRPNMVLVGGSFVASMLRLLDATRQFPEIEYYRYYRESQLCRSHGEDHLIAKPTPPVNFATDVFASDSLVLEVNEQTLPQPDHLVAFLRDALAALPYPQSGKIPFHSETRMPYRWGDTFSFVPGSSSVNPAATRGFGPGSPRGRYTVGRTAGLYFQTPTPPPADMVLEIDAGAFLANGHLPQQRVSVFANGHPVGEWTWNGEAFSRRALTIPRAFLAGGEQRLEFRLARPVSPYAFGLSDDRRELGLLVASVRLHAAGKAD